MDYIGKLLVIDQWFTSQDLIFLNDSNIRSVLSFDDNYTYLAFNIFNVEKQDEVIQIDRDNIIINLDKGESCEFTTDTKFKTIIQGQFIYLYIVKCLKSELGIRVGSLDENTVDLVTYRPGTNEPIQNGDYYTVNPRANLPFSIQGIEISKYSDLLRYDIISKLWRKVVSDSVVSDSVEVESDESVSGQSLTQRDVNLENKNLLINSVYYSIRE